MSHEFRIGLQLPEAERVVRWPEMLHIAQTAEAVGFDSLWVGDHLLYRAPETPDKGPWEAWSSLSALAAATTRVTIGPLVASVSFHAPAMLAKKASTVDEISGGRLVLGLGAGWNETEYRAFGFPFDHRVDRFEEAFAIIRTLLREGAIDFHGRYYELDGCRLLPETGRPGGPPLMIGSVGPRMLRITLPHVDAWNVWYADIRNDPSEFARMNKRVTAICEELGRDPATLSRTSAVLIGLPGGDGRPSLYEDVPASRPLRGSAEEIAAGLRAFRDAGADHIQLVLDPITVESVERVAPAVALARFG
jgi:probable F420-dependent oxidoreductase